MSYLWQLEEQFEMTDDNFEQHDYHKSKRASIAKRLNVPRFIMVGNANDVFNKSGAMVLCELDGKRGEAAEENEIRPNIFMKRTRSNVA